MLFLDRAHQRVYVKQWNMQTGAADFVEFGPVIESTPAEEAPKVEYVSLQAYQEDMDKLRKELAAIKKVIISDE